MQDILLSFLSDTSLHATLIAVVGSIVGYFAVNNVAIPLLNKAINHTHTQWGCIVEAERPFKQLDYIVPLCFAYYWMKSLPALALYAEKIISFFLVINLSFLINSILRTVASIYALYPIAKGKPVNGYRQAISLIIYLIAAIIGASILLDKDPTILLSSIAGFGALLMLVFKDTISSIVAGVHIVNHDLLHKGDWIEVPQFGANGDVIDMSLHYIRVQNFDKTIVNIPTYKLADIGFKNWRGMSDSKVRRIKRSLFIDKASIRALSDAEVRKILKKPEVNKRLADYKWTRDWSQTNLGLFRQYTEEFIRQHPDISNEATMLVRQLDPTPTGVPLELYIFSNDIVWSHYERIQAEIFEHLFSKFDDFQLRVFQRPTGYDTQKMYLSQEVVDEISDEIEGRAA
jgi:miniconductance mechanosensitive channel